MKFLTNDMCMQALLQRRYTTILISDLSSIAVRRPALQHSCYFSHVLRIEQIAGMFYPSISSVHKV